MESTEAVVITILEPLIIIAGLEHKSLRLKPGGVYILLHRRLDFQDPYVCLSIVHLSVFKAVCL